MAAFSSREWLMGRCGSAMWLSFFAVFFFLDFQQFNVI
jgi:hypothetical protein